MALRKLHIAGDMETQVDLGQRIDTLQREFASRDAEIGELREAFALFYAQWMRWDHQMQGHLCDLQAQVNTLEAERSSHEHGSTIATVPTSSALSPVAYRELITRIPNTVREVLPANATVLVVSRGDDALLKLDGQNGWHFPQKEDGVYAGYYPAESAEAIAHLEALREKGAEYLLFPSTSLWWLDHYTEFAYHLQTRYKVTVQRDDTCWIFDLHGERKSEIRQPTGSVSGARGYPGLKSQLRELVAVLLPSEATSLVVSKGDDELVKLCGDNAQHFPQGSDGGYAGYYPADSEEAIAHLETLRKQGADFLLFPSTAFWWLEYYRAFKEYLERHYRVVCRQRHVCLIFALKRRFSTNGQTLTSNL